MPTKQPKKAAKSKAAGSKADWRQWFLHLLFGDEAAKGKNAKAAWPYILAIAVLLVLGVVFNRSGLLLSLLGVLVLAVYFLWRR